MKQIMFIKDGKIQWEVRDITKELVIKTDHYIDIDSEFVETVEYIHGLLDQSNHCDRDDE